MADKGRRRFAIAPALLFRDRRLLDLVAHLDRVHDLLAVAQHLAEYRVLAVEKPSAFDAESSHSSLNDLSRLAWGFALGQRVNMLHAFDYLAPDGVRTIKEVCFVKADEELGVGAIRV
jgi:hypothetical protein